MMGIDMFDLAPAVTEIFLVCVAMALLMLGAFRDEEQDTHHFVSTLAIMALAVGLFIVLMGGKERSVTFSGLFISDGFAAYMKALVLIGVGVCPGHDARLLPEGRREPLRIYRAGAVRDRRHADDDFGQQPDFALCRPGAAELAALRDDRLPPRSPARFRGRPQIFRPRRSCFRHPPLWLLPGLRLHRYVVLPGTRRSLVAGNGRRGYDRLGCYHRSGVRCRRHGFQACRCALPHVGRRMSTRGRQPRLRPFLPPLPRLRPWR